jgi:hypothetical protein
MLKVKIDRAVLTKAIEYHTDDGDGMTVVIEDNSDLEDWTLRILAKLAGYDMTSIREETGLIVSAVDDGMLICVTANKTGEDVLDAIKHYIL